VYQDEWRSVTTIHDLLFRDFFLCRRVGDPFSPAGLPADRSICLSRSRVTEHEREQRGKERNEREREREREHGRTRIAEQDEPGGKAVIAKKDNARED